MSTLIVTRKSISPKYLSYYLNEEKKNRMKILTDREELDTTWLLTSKRVWFDTKYLAEYSVYLV